MILKLQSKFGVLLITLIFTVIPALSQADDHRDLTDNELRTPEDVTQETQVTVNQPQASVLSSQVGKGLLACVLVGPLCPAFIVGLAVGAAAEAAFCAPVAAVMTPLHEEGFKGAFKKCWD